MLGRWTVSFKGEGARSWPPYTSRAEACGGNRENRCSNAGDGDAECALSRSFLRGSQRGPLDNVVFRAWKYITSVHSLSFAVSFVLIGAIARSHDKYKGALRLLAHPVFLMSFFSTNFVPIGIAMLLFSILTAHWHKANLLPALLVDEFGIAQSHASFQIYVFVRKAFQVNMAISIYKNNRCYLLNEMAVFLKVSFLPCPNKHEVFPVSIPH